MCFQNRLNSLVIHNKTAIQTFVPCFISAFKKAIYIFKLFLYMTDCSNNSQEFILFPFESFKSKQTLGHFFMAVSWKQFFVLFSLKNIDSTFPTPHCKVSKKVSTAKKNVSYTTGTKTYILGNLTFSVNLFSRSYVHTVNPSFVNFSFMILSLRTSGSS